MLFGFVQIPPQSNVKMLGPLNAFGGKKKRQQSQNNAANTDLVGEVQNMH